MRRFLFLSSLIIIIMIMALLSGSLFVTESAPFHPGSLAFRLQDFAEQFRAILILDPYRQANWQLTLFDRRINDLAALAGTNREIAAMEALDSTVNRVSQVWTQLSIKDQPGLEGLNTTFVDLVKKANDTLQTGQSRPGFKDVEIYARVRAKLQAFGSMLSVSGLSQAGVGHLLQDRVSNPEGLAQVVATPTPTETVVDPQTVLFPPGSAGAIHAFYPLTGVHATVGCVTCHPTGQYKGTPKLCEDCHSQVVPTNHFPGDCAACHTTNAWKPANFDHVVAGATDCQSCHTKDRPVDHFQGQCSACHSTNAWKPASFNHSVAGVTDCQSCHTKDRPADHYQGQCSACHSTEAWKPASFNHAVAGATDCQTCHIKNRPANHFQGQCSMCHNTKAWLPASFNHSFPMNHGGAGGVCNKCHPGGSSAWTCFTCHNQASILKHHDKIANIASRCLSCHPKGGGGD